MIPPLVKQAIAPGINTIELGRHSATISEIQDSYVLGSRFETSTTREEIWKDWTEATRRLNEIVPIICVWIAGSFITNKLDPSDLDCVYWLDSDHVAEAWTTGAYAQNLLTIFSEKGSVKTHFNLKVDTFIGCWESLPEPSISNQMNWKYHRVRGYWDDFWQRERITPDPHPKTRADSILRRGYLEVILDDYRS